MQKFLLKKIRQALGCRGIELPQPVEAKISQFADETTLICRDADALKENMKVLNDFRDISGLRLNKKKTKAMWIGSSKTNRTQPMGFQSFQEPIKTSGTVTPQNVIIVAKSNTNAKCKNFSDAKCNKFKMQ